MIKYYILLHNTGGLHEIAFFPSPHGRSTNFRYKFKVGKKYMSKKYLFALIKNKNVFEISKYKFLTVHPIGEIISDQENCIMTIWF